MNVIGDAAAGPFAAACVVLAFAGASKIRHPLGTQPAAVALGLPSTRAAVRTLGGAEIIVAAAGLVIGGAAALAVAAAYGLLAFAAWRLLTRSPGTACGCLGASDAPATGMHVAVNVAAALAAVLAAASGAPFAAVGPDIWLGVAFVVLAGCCASLVSSALDALPSLAVAVREGGAE